MNADLAPCMTCLFAFLSIRIAAASTCPEYRGSVEEPDRWEYLNGLDVWNSNDVTTKLLNDLKKSFLDGKNVSVLGCDVPIDNIQCHYENLVPPTMLHVGAPFPDMNASVDLQCFQGLMSSSEIVDVYLPATDGGNFDGNFTVRFKNLHASFTVHAATVGFSIPVHLGFIDMPIPIPPISDVEPLQLDDMSVKVMFPLRGTCDEKEKRFRLHMGKLNFTDLELGMKDIHPLSNKLDGPVGGVCRKIGQEGMCTDIMKEIDSKASAELRRELVRVLPAVFTKDLGPMLQDVVQNARLNCLPKNLEHVVDAVSKVSGGDGTREVDVIVIGCVVSAVMLVALCFFAMYKCKNVARDACVHGRFYDHLKVTDLGVA